ncbi:MAG: hypothetical protein B6I24_10240 [Bacteroidetes bacterium 4572_128]|nr:MAG: hypothetical protein B6I24_10240 [Bacteroidetes bacterium 4572_128]
MKKKEYLSYFAEALKANYENNYIVAKYNFEKTIEINPNFADAYYNLATLLINDHFKNYKKAKEYYEKVIKINPHFVGVYYNLGILFFYKFKEYEKAKYHFEKAIKINPEHSRYYYHLANLLVNDHFKNYEKAKEYYEKAIKINPNNAEIHNILGVLFLDKFKKYEKAKEHFENAIKINPNFLIVYNNLLNLLPYLIDNKKSIESIVNILSQFHKKIPIETRIKFYYIFAKYFFNLGQNKKLKNKKENYEKAKEYYEKIIKINPNSVEAYINLAIILTDDLFKNYEKAKDHFEKTIKINPKHSKVYSNLANLLVNDHFKNYEKAKEYYEKAIKIDPYFAEMYNELGDLNFYKFKEYEKAKEHYEKAIKINPKYAKYYNNLANLLVNDHFKNYEKAKEYYEKAIKINPNYEKAHYNLGLLNIYKFKEYEKAKEHFEKTIKINSNSLEAHNNLGFLFFYKFKKYEKAKEHYEKAIKINPNYEKAHYSLAVLLADKFKEYEKAKEHYEKAIKINPKYSRSYYNLGVLFFYKFEEYEKAKEHFENAIKINSNYTKAHNNLGFLFLNKFKEYEKAKEHFEKTIKIDPNFLIAYNNLLDILPYLIDNEKSIESIVNIISQFHKEIPIETSIKFYYIFSDYFFDLGQNKKLKNKKENYEKAKGYYEKIIKINPNSARSYYGLAISFYEMKEYKKAREYYEKALKINPNFIKTAEVNLTKLDLQTFISKIKIKKVRHLKDISILIGENEMKHLIFTGDNGSGKTSVLEEIRDYINIEKKAFDLRFKWQTGNFVLAYFEAHRKFIGKTFMPDGRGIELPQNPGINENLAEEYFMPFTVLNKFQAMLLSEKGDNKVNENFKIWFANLKNILREIFDDENLEIEFQTIVQKLGINMEIKTKDRSKFNFEQLTDGYASILEIVFELILRMYNKTQNLYIMEGIVLIDEPESHLHIKMQKRLMPLLTKIFPKIQFIIATHSAFILNSIENALIYDLQTNTKTEKLSKIPVDKINDNYLTLNKKDTIKIEKEIEEFCALIKLAEQNKITEEQGNRIVELDLKLNDITPYISDDLFKKFKNAQKILY